MIAKTTLLITALTLSACSTPWKTTSPSQTALDQILISTAADRAASALVSNYDDHAHVEQNLGRTFIDSKNISSSNSDRQYALNAIRRSFSDANFVLVDDPKEADIIAEVGIGALSTDSASSLLGFPSMSLPIPLVGTVKTPEISILKKESDRGLAKFSISLRDKRTGKSRGKSFCSLGSARVNHWTVLLVFEFTTNDLQLPDYYDSISE